MNGRTTAWTVVLSSTLLLLFLACGRGPMFYAVDCGDGECKGDETCESCPEDCGECQVDCGDGECLGDETC